jgi:crotonobetainyl-CoA:carnitine CoA-transferase CaiB-like acyl-CoA transferase
MRVAAMPAPDSPGPLAGIRVVDTSNTFMAPYATLLMAQMGAEVIKVEEPGGDILRQVADTTGAGAGPVFHNTNQGKMSVVLDIRGDHDYAVLTRLVAEADVFVHNRPPAAARRLRVDYSSLAPGNPRLVHCGAFGYGSDGPYRDLPAYDDVIQAASGFAYVQTNGGEPQYVRSSVADKTSGLFVLAAILAALYERERSGFGQAVEVPMFESMASFILLEQQGGAVYDPPRGAPLYARTASVNRHPYRTADGLIAVMLYTDKHWQTFFRLVDRPDLASDARFATMSARTANTDALYGIVESELKARPTAEWLRLLGEHRIPATTVNSITDILDDPHIAAVGLIQESQHPEVGRIRTPRLPVTFSRSKPPVLGPAPLLGQHNHLLDELDSDRACG